jgi:DNA-directed RNA polymerase subunit RPC12/RpoP
MTERTNSYNCRNCGEQIGEINSSGELVMETTVLERGSIRCRNCGAAKDWYECDQKLERIIDKIVQRRLTNYVTL